MRRHFLSRQFLSRRRGHTLIELLVAIVVAAIVTSIAAGTLLWIYRQSHGSQGTTDRLERRQLLRQTLFQLGRQNRTLRLEPGLWSLFRRTDTQEDTLTIQCRDTALVRNGLSLTRGDSLVSCRFSPLGRHFDLARDPWLENLGSALEPPATDTLAFVRVHLVLQAPQLRGTAPVAPDTLDLRIPL